MAFIVPRRKQKEKLNVWIMKLDIHTRRGLNPEVVSKIKNLFYFHWNYNFKDLYVKSRKYFASMETEMKLELQEKLLSDLIAQFPLFFKKIDKKLAFQLIFFLEPRVFLAGNLILEENRVSDGVYFIVSGSVVIDTFNFKAYEGVLAECQTVVRMKCNPPCRQLKKGSFFGEDFFIDKRSICRVECGAKEKVQTLFLGRGHLEDVASGLKSKKMQLLNLLSFKRRMFFTLV